MVSAVNATAACSPLATDLAGCNRAYREFFDALAPRRASWLERNRAYHRLLEREYRFFIGEGQRVLEVGCGLGNLLAALRPAVGVGVDLSPEMIRHARALHDGSNLRFVASAVEDLDLGGETFDAIVMSDLLCYLYDIGAVFERLAACCHPRTRLVMNFHSRLWEPLFGLATRLGRKARVPVLNWVTRGDVEGMLRLAGFESVWCTPRILLPARLPVVAPLVNRLLASFWPFSHLCVTNLVVARPLAPPFAKERSPVVSVVVPCRNEAGHMLEIADRVPEMGTGTELILVEGGSSDDTFERCLEAQRRHPERSIQVLRQTGRGKGDAVRLGFASAHGEVLMILDADMTVPPEDLPQFYRALASGRAELVNGSRLVYAMEPGAMRWLNLIANKVFGHAFSFLLGQRVKDTLCGTKVLLRQDYERLAAARAYFGELDPFGDFDLLFGAAKLGLRIADLPIRYRERAWGATNISRFRHGLLLARMCWRGLWLLRCR